MVKRPCSPSVLFWRITSCSPLPRPSASTMRVSFAPTMNFLSATGDISLSTQRLNQQFCVSEHFIARYGPLNFTLKYTPLQSYVTSEPSTSVLPVYSMRLSDAGVSISSLVFFAPRSALMTSARTVMRVVMDLRIFIVLFLVFI